MQTLSIGSFVSLDHREKVEALKFTAAALAENAAKAVPEQITAQTLANLANSFWEKAEYVTREVERRQLQQIFVDNFTEQFNELKPNPQKENQIEAVADHVHVEINDSQQTVEAVGVGFDQRNNTTSDALLETSKGNSIDASESDEFLGFVENSSPASSNNSDSEMSALEETNVIEQPQNQIETNAATAEVSAKLEMQTPDVEILGKQSVAVAPAAEKRNEAAQTVAVVKPHTAANAKSAAQEPFEFNKCTINFNFTLLPAESNKARRILLSAASHDLPPEVDLIEITDGNDLTVIVEAVRGKLARFKQSLPAKYIEQLRQAKSKQTSKKSVPTATIPLPAKPADPVSSVIKNESGGQKTEVNAQEVDQSNAALEPKTAPPAGSSVLPTAANNNRATAPNQIQPSLF